MKSEPTNFLIVDHFPLFRSKFLLLKQFLQLILLACNHNSHVLKSLKSFEALEDGTNLLVEAIQINWRS